MYTVSNRRRRKCLLLEIKLAYPMHGAGVIEGIEEQTILGTPRRYYVLRLSHSDMKVMVPVENSQQVGVRYIVGASDIDDVVSVLHSDSTPMSDNWNKRNRDNMEKLKTGDLKEIAEVVRNLLRADHRKKLSTGEKKMLNNAKQLLLSEFVLVKNISVDNADQMIEDAVLEGIEH